MSTVLWSLGAIVVLLAGGWIMRLAGQSLTGNKPFFRDMPLAVAFGYVLGAALLLFGIWYYFQPAVTADGVPVASVQFFRWAVQGVLIGAAAAFVFRLIGRTLGTAGSRKMFRQMPLTAAFGVLVILIYALLAIFAPALAPHGQEEV
ncbi:MAG: ABC transporter permease, partial [Mameliella sp.]|nr:ABC transporter permease [Mameliella sp.]